MQQGSPEWHAVRCGKVTASRVHDIVAVTRSGGYTAGRKNYLTELVWERLTGEPAEQYVTAAMAHGSEMEPQARFAYALERGVEVVEVGFIEHPTIPLVGASPDGLVGADGLIEIKVPNGAQHLDMLLGDKIEPKYITQMQAQMMCTGRAWVDFVSYHHNLKLPSKMQLNIRRVERDAVMITKMELEITQFLIDLDATVDLLRKRYMQDQAA